MFTTNTAMTLSCIATIGGIVYGTQVHRDELPETDVNAFLNGPTWSSPAGQEPLVVGESGYELSHAVTRWHGLYEEAVEVELPDHPPRMPVKAASKASSAPKPKRLPKAQHATPAPKRAKTPREMYRRSRAHQDRLERDKQRSPRRYNTGYQALDSRVARAIREANQGPVVDRRKSVFEKSRYFRANGSTYQRLGKRRRLERGKIYIVK